MVYLNSLWLFPGKEGSHLSQKEREEKIRALRDRQNEERQRKLEELKQQALAAQKFREQKEEERRRRIDELRQRDSDRRHQVEERKRQIWEAERDRREAILRKNQVWIWIHCIVLSHTLTCVEIAFWFYGTCTSHNSDYHSTVLHFCFFVSLFLHQLNCSYFIFPLVFDLNRCFPISLKPVAFVSVFLYAKS